jgi:RimJ/RimL family protein N-acetyltransferase
MISKMMKIDLVAAALGDLVEFDGPLLRGVTMGFSSLDEARASLGDVLGTMLRTERPATWGAFWALSETLDAYAGLCAFKTAPDVEGAVELAYYTFPLLEGRGAASGMARELVQLAKSQGASALIANTLPQENASSRILTQTGFAFRGPAQDPEDGLVWTWRLDLGRT